MTVPEQVDHRVNWSRPVGGIIARIGTGLPPLTAAAPRAPWRGPITSSVRIDWAEVCALGDAIAGRWKGLLIAVDGRFDNASELARKVNAPPDDLIGLSGALYDRYGASFAGEVHGEFAIVIVDPTDRSIAGYRDWAAIRPLFWGRTNAGTAFASEVKLVLASLDCPFRINDSLVGTYERQDWSAASDATFSSDVFAVEPSGFVLMRAGSETIRGRRSLRFEPVDLRVQERHRLVRVELERAIQRRALPRRALGTLVSGGVDSTAVTAIAGDLLRRGMIADVVLSITTRYAWCPQCDETELAREVATRSGISWVPVSIERNHLVESDQTAFDLHDGPTPVGFGIYGPLLKTATAAGIEVLFDGQGGNDWLDQDDDELWLSALREEWRNVVRWAFHDPLAAAWYGLPRAVQGRVRGTRAESYFEENLDDFWFRWQLEAIERAAAFNGIRAASPLLDRSVAALLAGLPPSVRSQPGRAKGLLRDVMNQLLDSSIVERLHVTLLDPALRDAAGLSVNGESTARRLAKQQIVDWKARISS